MTHSRCSLHSGGTARPYSFSEVQVEQDRHTTSPLPLATPPAGLGRPLVVVETLWENNRLELRQANQIEPELRQTIDSSEATETKQYFTKTKTHVSVLNEHLQISIKFITVGFPFL